MGEASTLPTPTVSLDARLTKLVEPELRLQGFASEDLVGQWLHLQVRFNDAEAVIVHAEGVILAPERPGHFRVTSAAGRFSLVLAPPGPRRSGKVGFQVLPSPSQLVGNIYPYVSLRLDVTLSREDAPLLFTFRCRLPPHTSWYTHDTDLLQRTLEEVGVTQEDKFVGGRADGRVRLHVHLKHEPIVALRKALAPVLIVIAALLIDLSVVMQAGADGQAWRSNPLALLGLFSVNLGAFSSIAALDGGPQTTTLVNFERALATLFLLFLTLLVREGGVPGTLLLVDGFLKGALVWIGTLAGYTFLIYGYLHDPDLRRRWLGRFAAGAGLLWLLAMILMDPLGLARQAAAAFG